MYEKTNKKIDIIIKDKKDQAELLYVNFDLRFKILMNRFASYKKQ